VVAGAALGRGRGRARLVDLVEVLLLEDGGVRDGVDALGVVDFVRVFVPPGVLALAAFIQVLFVVHEIREIELVIVEPPLHRVCPHAREFGLHLEVLVQEAVDAALEARGDHVGALRVVGRGRGRHVDELDEPEAQRQGELALGLPSLPRSQSVPWITAVFAARAPPRTFPWFSTPAAWSTQRFLGSGSHSGAVDDMLRQRADSMAVAPTRVDD
jgi:hypothetical protein